MKCPTEIAITDRREAELAKAGFCRFCIGKIPISQHLLGLSR